MFGFETVLFLVATRCQANMVVGGRCRRVPWLLKMPLMSSLAD